MSLQDQISEQLKAAMKSKDQAALRTLRSIKAALLLLNTQEGKKEVSAEDEVAAIVKMAKQRKDSIAIFEEQGRNDLADKEKEELAILEGFLPKQLSAEELKTAVSEIISQTGASSMKDMGKVMGMASSKLKGQADGKDIAAMVKSLLA
jgi:uncharacterized protein YqeY